MDNKTHFFQVKAIFQKNLVCSFRNREFLAETLIPLICGLSLAAKDIDGTSLIAFFSPFFVSLAIFSNPRSLLIHLCEEKEQKFKETQKIMGLKQSSYLLGWMLYAYFKTFMSMIIFFISWTGFGYIMNYSHDRNIYGFDSQTDWYVIFGLYFIYGISLIHYSMFLTTFFSKSKTANEITTLLLVVSLILPFFGFVEKFQSTFFFILISIFPQTCIALSYLSTQYGAFRTLSIVVNYYFSYETMAIQLVILSVLFLLLYFYLDAIIPNEYGIAKHPLFFLHFNKNEIEKRKVDLENPLMNEQEGNVASSTYNDDSSSAYYHEQRNYLNMKPSVKIRQIVKKFGNFTAVDQVSLNLYSKEILCLLGHNGAGKTTTINVLTGLLSLSGGKVYVYDQELESNLEEIRERIGICNQRDVLYDELTVKEQLQFMGRIKGLEGNDLEQEIQQILTTTLLNNEKDKITKTLSGGNKRKLSLAQAIIGGSNVLFLDEPTSGMDAQTRRGIWEILEKVKLENRTLVLTTHHLDEAEELADRIAIMAAGKLLACGRSEYIKQNFGEGYSISITILDKVIDKDEIIHFTQENLPQAILDPQSSQLSILFKIKFNQKKFLLNYFKALEKKFDDKLSVNFKINSLEDAFINIGMDEERFLEKAKKMVEGRTSINEDRDSIIGTDQFAELKSKVPVPNCLNREPVYSFKQQTFAIYLRKFYTTIRTFSNYLAILIPFALMITGIIVIGEMDLGEEDEQTKIIRMIFFSLFAIIALCFNSSLFIMQPVLERETNLKYALVAMGCRPFPYWLGTFLFDFTIYFGMIFLIILISLSYEFLSEKIGKLIFIFFSFGVSFIVFSYFIGTLLYEKASKAMKTFPFLNYFVFFALPLNAWLIVALIFMQGNSSDQLSDGQTVVIKLVDLLCSLISPFYSFFQAIIKSIDIENGNGSVPYISKEYWVYCLLMIIQSVGFFFLNILIENKKYYKGMYSNNLRCNNYIPAQINDPEVLKEIDQISKGTINPPIKVLHLQKQYNPTNFLAVKDITFGVAQNEILGLLGPNGAGKSSTFNILTSLITKSSGSVKIKGVEIDRTQSDIFRDTGICPQFDCLWENLTPQEHLYLFGRMKGLNGTDLDQSVAYFLSTMQLEEYISRKSGLLSGGNKRKLCVSNALIGGPSIQFFDEPSTGVDPIARRFLWKTLRLGVKLRQSSVVLTTHTMDEAESLCDRIAIMINGEIFCLGNPKELRDRYGEGYKITIRNPNNRQQILNIIKQKYSQATETQETHEEYQSIHIPTNQFQFYNVFQLLSDLESQNYIQDFTINQSTLESVFLQFSQFQQQQQQIN
ncbi:unnamed protein product [Paramecium sonneborni]|uniref:ABC transporter domain-containing protein n=1 Tax=Paramecium sonneborni TaxID=65129 RepID=A0A8S1K5S4_9CILI|nr:unnamed protein product [Paramecium sonneborni]